jgi:hypothetical protein
VVCKKIIDGLLEAKTPDTNAFNQLSKNCFFDERKLKKDIRGYFLTHNLIHAFEFNLLGAK